MSDVAQLRLRLAAVQRQLLDGAARGVGAAGGRVLDTSNQDVPLGRGTLQASGKVTTDPQRLTAVVSYDTDYAVDAHEDMDLDHDSGRRAKFLETAFNTERTRLGDVVADEVRGELRR